MTASPVSCHPAVPHPQPGVSHMMPIALLSVSDFFSSVLLSCRSRSLKRKSMERPRQTARVEPSWLPRQCRQMTLQRSSIGPFPTCPPGNRLGEVCRLVKRGDRVPTSLLVPTAVIWCLAVMAQRVARIGGQPLPEGAGPGRVLWAVQGGGRVGT